MQKITTTNPGSEANSSNISLQIQEICARALAFVKADHDISSAELMSWSAFTKANARAQISWICSEMLLEFASLPGLVVVIFCILTHHYIQPGQFCPDPA